jgi:hypothetical protein
MDSDDPALQVWTGLALSDQTMPYDCACKS